jgi:uncharacterized protein
MWTALIVITRVLALIYVGLCVVLTLNQRNMLYLPSRGSLIDAQQRAAAAGLTAWRDTDGRLIGWQTPTTSTNTPSPADAVLILHGNGGEATHRTYLLAGFPNAAHYILEYPGYGSRPGTPSQAAFVDAALQAVDQLRTTHTGALYLIGESIGSGVAAQTAAARPDAIAGLLLITPFNSLTDVAQHHYPLFPVRWLLRDRYDSSRALQAYNGPVAILLAEADEVVPARFGQALYGSYTGPKRSWIQPDRDHNNLDYQPTAAWWREVDAFLRTTPQASAPNP